MNTRLVALSVLSTALGMSAVPALSAAPQTALGYWASEITVNPRVIYARSKARIITAGTARATVLSLLGQPKQVLAPNVFVYDNCRIDQRLPGRCDNLIVTFKQEQVVSLRFVNDRATMVIAADLPHHTAPLMAQTGFSGPSR